MRLEELAHRLGDDISIRWRSFLLRPVPEERSVDEFRDYTNKWARPAELEPLARFTYPWSGGAPPAGSVPSAIAGKVAETFGAAAAASFHRQLLGAYFTENRTISDLETLVAVADEAGLDSAAFLQTYRDRNQMLLREVYDDHNAAVNAGVTGVPAVVVDDRYLVPGAVDVEYYEQVLDHVRRERTTDG